MKNILKVGIAVLILIIYSARQGRAQQVSQTTDYNPISTSVPFLTMAPDSRHSAMGDAGAATSADANAQFYNPSKYAFAEGRFGLALSYMPWMHALVSDISLTSLAGYFKLDDRQALASSLRYYSMGDIVMTGMDQVKMGTFSPNEFALDMSYSRKLSEHLSGGVSLRYIHSDLTGGVGVASAGMETYKAGNAFSSDVSFFYTNSWGITGGENTLSAGINLSNIGSKISYDQGVHKDFLPASLRLGTTYTRVLDDNNSLAFSLDFNKLMVPTPKYGTITDMDGNITTQIDNSNTQPVISSIFNSFSDAPGGLKEELQEITQSFGVEYWFRSRFAVRGGYFNESQNKGDRKYVTSGVGVKMKYVSLDVSYAMPVRQNSPMANTIRLTLHLNLGPLTQQSKVPLEPQPATSTEKSGEEKK